MANNESKAPLLFVFIYYQIFKLSSSKYLGIRLLALKASV